MSTYFDATAATAIMKTMYLPRLQKYINRSTILLSRVQRDSDTQDTNGNFTIAINNAGSLMHGSGRAVMADLPEYGQQVYKNAIVPNKRTYARIAIAGPVIRQTKTNAQAFVRALESEMKGATEDFKRSLNRQLHSDGVDALAYIQSVGAYGTTTAVTVDDGNGNAFTHLTPGQAAYVDILDAGTSYNQLYGKSASGATQRTFTLGAEAATNFAGTLSGDATGASIADGDPIILEATKGEQKMGLAGIVSDADPPLLSAGLHGLAVATEPWWKAQVIGSDSTKVDITFPLIQKAFSRIAANTAMSEKDINLLLCSYGVRDKYVELCSNERMFMNTMTLDGGFEAANYNGKPLVPDAQCKWNRLYVLCLDSLVMGQASDIEWMEDDGAVLCRIQNKDAYEATLFHLGDLGCKMRNANAVCLGINQ